MTSFSFHAGDSLAVLRTFPDESVHSIVTSPPYFALRDYQVNGQIGREATPGAYIAALVAVFREARRVLRKDGTLWLNLGDSYVNKQLLCIPHRVAMALQDDGWLLRCDAIWEKPNACPESVGDRPSRSHEYVFLFARSEKSPEAIFLSRWYFYDREAVCVPCASSLSGSRLASVKNGSARVTPSGTPRKSPEVISLNRFLAGGNRGDRSEVRGGFVFHTRAGGPCARSGRSRRALFSPDRAGSPTSIISRRCPPISPGCASGPARRRAARCSTRSAARAPRSRSLKRRAVPACT